MRTTFNVLLFQCIIYIITVNDDIPTWILKLKALDQGNFRPLNVKSFTCIKTSIFSKGEVVEVKWNNKKSTNATEVWRHWTPDSEGEWTLGVGK